MTKSAGKVANLVDCAERMCANVAVQRSVYDLDETSTRVMAYDYQLEVSSLDSLEYPFITSTYPLACMDQFTFRTLAFGAEVISDGLTLIEKLVAALAGSNEVRLHH